MKKCALFCVGILLAVEALSQTVNDFMIHAHTDLIKSNHSGYFEKVQTGAEVNYFFSPKFTATGGVEFWTDGDEVSLVLGGRWFPVPEAFVRLRGLIGVNEVSVGGGWAKPLSDKWKFEALGDVYTGGNIAIRAGVAYILRVK